MSGEGLLRQYRKEDRRERGFPPRALHRPAPAARADDAAARLRHRRGGPSRPRPVLPHRGGLRHGQDRRRRQQGRGRLRRHRACRRPAQRDQYRQRAAASLHHLRPARAQGRHRPVHEGRGRSTPPRRGVGRQDHGVVAKSALALHHWAMAQSMHDVSDPRNASILINVNGELKPRAEAVVSVFDSGFMLGDGVWEGLRVHKGRLAFLDRHLDRLFEGAKAIAMDIGLTRAELAKRLYDTLDTNGMSEGVHVRLMVTRGVRATPYQDPRVVVGGATVVIIPEYKQPPEGIHQRGLKLFTVHVRRGDPAVQDPKLNSHSKLNCILASIQATQAGADEALMLDPLGFVATCNSTHFFIVRKGEVWTSSGKYCLGGITRGLALEIAREAGINEIEKDFSLTDVYGADEAFVTGTFAGIVPVREVDGRKLTCPGPMVERLRKLYAKRVEQDVREQQRP